MPVNEGISKENEMIESLNDKRVCELSNNLKNLIHALFGLLDEEEIITCEKQDIYIKPDFKITYKGESKYISMKTGRSESIHQETVKDFVLFLRSLGISKKTQGTILLYHYGDGTMDGTGKKRYEYEDLRKMLKERIIEANIELNSSQEIIEKTFERCLFLGNRENAIEIDGIYYGTYEFGVLTTKKQIMKHVLRKNWNYISTPHIGPLQIRPHARYVNKPIRDPHRRERTDIYWANFGDDLEFMSKRYDY